MFFRYSKARLKTGVAVQVSITACIVALRNPVIAGSAVHTLKINFVIFPRRKCNFEKKYQEWDRYVQLQEICPFQSTAVTTHSRIIYKVERIFCNREFLVENGQNGSNLVQIQTLLFIHLHDGAVPNHIINTL